MLKKIQMEAAIRTPDNQLLTDKEILTQKRYTPFTKTPNTRKSARVPRTPLTEEESVDIRGLIKKTFRTYSVTPLHSFASTPQSLRKYSRLLSLHICAESKKGTAFANDEENADKANFNVFQGLKHRDHDNDAIEIQLINKQKSKDNVVLTAVLCGVDLQTSFDGELPRAFTWHPVMLIKGGVTLAGHLITWLQKQFDCTIQEFHFSSYDLSWMVAMWSGCIPQNEGGKFIELVYDVPSSCEGLKTITMSVDSTHCLDLLQSIHDDDADEFTADEVALFIRSIEQHFYHHFKIHLSAMSLTRIGTSIVMSGAQGKLKIFSIEYVHAVLGYLTTLAVERIQLLLKTQ